MNQHAQVQEIHVPKLHSKTEHRLWQRDIHKEIFSALPQKEQDAITADLESLARGDKELPPIKVDETGKPELTADYLRAIGKPEYIEWGTDRQWRLTFYTSLVNSIYENST